MLCASYRLRFEEWPREAHLHPGWLWALADILEGSDFERLATRLELTTLADAAPERPGFVSGEAGRVWLEEQMPRVPSEELEKWYELWEEARDWLAVKARPPRGD